VSEAMRLFLAGKAYLYVPEADYRTFLAVAKRLGLHWENSTPKDLPTFIPYPIVFRGYTLLRLEQGSLVWSTKSPATAASIMPVGIFTYELIPKHFWSIRVLQWIKQRLAFKKRRRAPHGSKRFEGNRRH